MFPQNRTESLKFLVDVSRELSSLTGNDDQRIPAYWVRTCRLFSEKLTRKLVTVYNNTNHPSNQNYENKITPEEARYPGMEKQLREIYELYEDELNEDFMVQTEDGKKKVNIDWLKISGNFEEGEFDKEDEKFIMSMKENKGIRIIVDECTPEEIKQGKVSVEMPLSQLLRAALYLDKKGIQKPKYPYVVIYAIYNLFKFFVDKDKLSPRVLSVIDEIYARREILLEKEKTKIDDSMNSLKQLAAPLISSNKDAFSSITDQIDAGLNDLNDETIDQVADQCHQAISLFKSKEKKDLSQVIGDMIGADTEKVKETMEKFGLHEGNIRAMVDGVSGGMSNEQLKKSIPAMDDIDSIINGLNTK